MDLTGKQFGRLTVIEYAGDYKWRCRCECGTEKNIRGGDLIAGRTKSCGCLRKELIRDRRLQDLTGLRFGRLQVVGISNTEYNHVTWKCACDCGNTIEAPTSYLVSGDTKSCGCLKSETMINRNLKHGFSHKERLYHIWKGMHERCENANSISYENYGGRGIQVCEEWDDYAVFREWALANGYDESLPTKECTIDRKDNNKGYYPWNCQWASMTIQAANRRPRGTKRGNL